MLKDFLKVQMLIKEGGRENVDDDDDGDDDGGEEEEEDADGDGDADDVKDNSSDQTS